MEFVHDNNETLNHGKTDEQQVTSKGNNQWQDEFLIQLNAEPIQTSAVHSQPIQSAESVSDLSPIDYVESHSAPPGTKLKKWNFPLEEELNDNVFADLDSSVITESGFELQLQVQAAKQRNAQLQEQLRKAQEYR